jgi:hypothetical protein
MADEAKFVVNIFKERVDVRWADPDLRIQVSDPAAATFDPSGSGVVVIPDVNGEVWSLNPKSWSVIRVVPVEEER